MLRNDAHNLNQAISRRTQEEVFAIARKAFLDLAGTSLEERMTEVFTRRLRELNNEAKEGLGKALKTLSDPVLVRSAFELPSEQRASIQKTLNEIFSAEIRIRFEASPTLISGIELTANGQKVAWSIADYLTSLEKGVDELLKKKDKPAAKVEPKPEAKVEPKPEANPSRSLMLKLSLKLNPSRNLKLRPNQNLKLRSNQNLRPNPSRSLMLKLSLKLNPSRSLKLRPNQSL